MSNFLEDYFNNNTGKKISKPVHYFEIYDRHFSKFRNTDVNVLEIGVAGGGSLQMWKHYFGPKAKIYGLDVAPVCKEHEEEQVKIFIGDQSDRTFLKDLTKKISIDILIDDGGHQMHQQIITFEELFPHISAHGVYLCEDIGTSYWSEFGGSYKKPDTFIEYTKNFIDWINAWDARGQIAITEFTKTTHSIHFYNFIVVVEKRPMLPPGPTLTK